MIKRSNRKKIHYEGLKFIIENRPLLFFLPTAEQVMPLKNLRFKENPCICNLEFTIPFPPLLHRSPSRSFFLFSFFFCTPSTPAFRVHARDDLSRHVSTVKSSSKWKKDNSDRREDGPRDKHQMKNLLLAIIKEIINTINYIL